MNSRIYRVHSWLGLFNGLIITLISLSGMALIFRSEIEVASSPSLLVSSSAIEATSSVDSAYQNIRNGYPLQQVNFIVLPRSAKDVFRFRLTEKGKTLEVFADRVTGKILGERAEESNFFQKVFLIHRTLLLGETGKVILFFFGISLLVSTLSGLYVYRNSFRKLFRRKTLRTETIKNLPRFHATFGSIVFVTNLLFATTGAVMQWQAVTKLFSPAKAAEKEHSQTPYKSNQSLDTLLLRSQSTTATFHPFSIGLPKDSTKPIVIRGRFGTSPLIPPSKSSVEFDSKSGRQQKVVSALGGNLFENITIYALPLHTGNFGGMFLKSIYFLMGACPGTLALTGFILRWRRSGRLKTVDQ